MITIRLIFCFLLLVSSHAVTKSNLKNIQLEIIVEDTRLEKDAGPWIHIGQAPYVFWSTMWESHSYCDLKKVSDSSYQCLIEEISLKRLLTSSIDKPYDLALGHRSPVNTDARRWLCEDVKFKLEDLNIKCRGLIFKKCKATIKLDHCQL